MHQEKDPFYTHLFEEDKDTFKDSIPTHECIFKKCCKKYKKVGKKQCKKCPKL